MNLKHLLRDIALSGLALVTAAGITGCKDDFDTPPVDIPVATMQPNSTIAEVKADLWDDATNYAVLVPQKADGSDYIVHGRVISSDASGNIYKSLVIQDETGALPFSVNQNSLYNTYRVGQEIVVNLTGAYIGKYAGYEQIGGYGTYNGTPQTSFMSYEDFQGRAELNGLPEPSMTVIPADGAKPEFSKGIYCLVADLASLPSTPAGQQAWQGQLIELRNVHFEGGGSEPYVAPEDYNATPNRKSTSRTLVDAAGNTITVRNSGYASFAQDIMPSGNGTVRGILSYFNNSWQLLLRSTADVIFDSKGNLDDPYSVAEAVELQGTGAAGWVSGYIVGSVKGGVTNVSANDQVIWGSNAEMDNTLVIGPTADCKDITKCLVIELPQGSALRQYGNLLDNPGVYGKAIKAYGNFAPVLGANGISGNTGSTAEWQIDGVTVGPNPGGDAVASLFCDFEGYNKQISNLVEAGWTVTKTSGDKNWYLNEFSGNTYAAATAYKGTTGPWDEWLISPAIDLSKSPKKTLTFKCQAAYQSTTSTMKVYVLTSADPNTATKTELTVTLPEIPASGYSSWVESTVDLSAFSGIIYIGWEYTGTSSSGSSTYCIDDVNIGGANGGGGGGGGRSVSIKLDKDTVSGVVGDKIKVTATVTGSTAKPTWTSSNEDVATVDENGNITLVGKGTATVKVKVNGVVKNIPVTVKEATATPTPVPTVKPTEAPVINTEYTKPYASGYDDGSFLPNNNITRGELAAMIARLSYGDDLPDGMYQASFPDVDSDAWFNKYIGYLEDKDVLSGYEDGTFRPMDTITRGEISAVIARAQRYDLISYNGIFTDVTENDWAKDYIETLADKNIVSGYEDGTFGPYSPLTRAEAVAIINRVLVESTPIVTFTPNDIAGHWAEADILLAVNERMVGANAVVPTVKPEETAAPEETVAPETTVTPEATVAPEKTTAPEATPAA